MKHVLVLSVVLASMAARAEVFLEDFSAPLDVKRWSISQGQAPHHSGTNKASFRPDHVSIVDGVLRIKLVQFTDDKGVVNSIGGEIKTIALFGYGTYEFELKASSDGERNFVPGVAVSGSITGAASYRTRSETEIDVEVEGVANKKHLTHTSTWTDENQPSQITSIPPTSRYSLEPHQQFYKYRYVWSPGKVVFYRNNKLISTHSAVIPSKPAHFLFNHWGTHSQAWGGLATPGITRYIFVRRFSFTPLETKG